MSGTGNAYCMSRVEAHLSSCSSPAQRLHSPAMVTVNRHQTAVGSFVCKRQSAERVSEGREQVGAEVRAAAAVQRVCGGPCPLVCAPGAVEFTSDGAAHFAYVDAGECLAVQMAGPWAGRPAAEREALAKTMMVCLLKAVGIYQAVPEELGGAHAHMDIKPDNICVRKVPGGSHLFVLIDHGGFCPTSGTDFSALYGIRYLDNMQASYLPAEGCHAIDDADTLQAKTHLPTIDLRQIGMAVVELFCGLPAKVDATKHRDLHLPQQRSDFLRGVFGFWLAWLNLRVEAGCMPAAMADCLACVVAPKPAQRTQSATELLQHPWLAGEVAAVDATVAAAAPAWEAANAALAAMAASSMQHHDDAASSSSSSCVDDTLAGAPDASCFIAEVAVVSIATKGSSRACCTASHHQQQQQQQPEAVASVGCLPWLTAGGSSSSSSSCRLLAKRCGKALSRKASQASRKVAKAFKACCTVFA